MMKKKTVGSHVYYGLGFPIKLRQVEMVKIEGDWHPKIDVRKVADNAIKNLILKKTRLTGNEIKFIRNYFSMSLRDFAAIVVHESHTAVHKWEKRGDKEIKMDPNIEIVLRLFIQSQMSANTEKQKNDFYHRYVKVNQIFSSHTRKMVSKKKPNSGEQAHLANL